LGAGLQAPGARSGHPCRWPFGLALGGRFDVHKILSHSIHATDGVTGLMRSDYGCH
jgi:hypothetical protein